MSQAVAPAPDNGGLLSFIERASHDPEFDVNKFEALLRMQREIITEQGRRAFNQAMAAAQAEMLPVIRDAANTHTQSRYARLETIDQQMRPIYTKHGFAVRYGSEPSPNQGWLRIVCTVSHIDGYAETNYLDAPPDSAGQQGRSNKTPVQAVGSSVTYLRRYLLAMVFNIVLANDPDDDDGSLGRTQQQPRQQPRQQERQPINDPFPELSEPHGPTWLGNLKALLERTDTLAIKIAITDDERVQRVLRTAPRDVVADIREMLKFHHQRLEAAQHQAQRQAEQPTQTWDQDPIADLLGDIEKMTLEDLEQLPRNAAWQKRIGAAFPPDADRLEEAVNARKAALKGTTT